MLVFDVNVVGIFTMYSTPSCFPSNNTCKNNTVVACKTSIYTIIISILNYCIQSIISFISPSLTHPSMSKPFCQSDQLQRKEKKKVNMKYLVASP